MVWRRASEHRPRTGLVLVDLCNDLGDGLMRKGRGQSTSQLCDTIQLETVHR